MNKKNILAVMLVVVMCFVITACGSKAPNVACYDNTGFAKLENQFISVEDEELAEWAEYYGGELVGFEDNAYSYEVDITEVPNGVIYEYTLTLLDGEKSAYDPVDYEGTLSSYEIRDKVEDTIAWGKILPEYIGEDPTDLSLSEYVDNNGNVMLVSQGFSSNSNSYTICIRYVE